MQATTIKIENPLLSDLKLYLPKEESITSFVKSILEQEIQRKKMIQSAEEYAAFLETHQEEKESMEEWENADLNTSPKTKIKAAKASKKASK